ncbi:MAG: Ig-like domain-containing protein [Eubacteriales bacterium]|nr:Ig-like domain-containing protein [Eubacteriales bacterium]
MRKWARKITAWTAVVSMTASLLFSSVQAEDVMLQDAAELLENAGDAVEEAASPAVAETEQMPEAIDEGSAIEEETQTEWQEEFTAEEEELTSEETETGDLTFEDEEWILDETSLEEETAEPEPVYAEPVIENGLVDKNLKKITPYSYHNAAVQTDEETASSGVQFKDAIIFTMGYTGLSNGNTGQIDYNFKGEYSSMSFQLGYYGGTKRDAKLTVIADGIEVIKEQKYAYNTFAANVTVDLNGVSHLTIKLVSDGYDKVRYVIGNSSFSRAVAAHEEIPLTSNITDNCELIMDGGTSVLDDSETYAMGGYEYQGGISMSMYSNFGSTTQNASFNLQKHYYSMTFDIAKYNPTAYYVRNAQLTITADDQVVLEKKLSWNDISYPVQLDLHGVQKLTIQLVSSGYDKVEYRMGNIHLVSDGAVQKIIFRKNKLSVSPKQPQVQLEPVIIPNDAYNKNFTATMDTPNIADMDENYLVTGRHKGTAIVTAVAEADPNITAKCEITSTMPAARYIPSVDGWGFTNKVLNIFTKFTDENWDFSVPDYYKNMYQRISGEYPLYTISANISKANKLTELTNAAISGPAQLWYILGGTNANGGLCYGYSLASALTYTGDLKFSQWDFGVDTPENPGQVEALLEYYGYSSALDLYLQQLIYGCFISQGTKSAVLNKWLHKDKYNDLINAVKNFQNTGKKPILINLNTVHTVLPYEVLEIGNKIYVYIYDCNLDDNPDDNRITFTKDDDGTITGWSYDSYSNLKGEITYVDSLSTISDRLKKSATLDLVTKIVYSTANSVSVTKNGNVLMRYSHGVYSGDTSQSDAAPFTVAGASSESYQNGAAIAVFSDDVTIQNTSGEERVLTYIAEPDATMIVESDGNSKITQTGDKTLEITPSKKGTVAVQYNYGNDKVIKVTGEADRNVQVAADPDKGLTFTGYRNAKITVLKDEEEVTGKTRTLQPMEEYTASTEGTLEGNLTDEDNTEPEVTNPEKKDNIDQSMTKPGNQAVLVKSIEISGMSQKIAAGKKVQLMASVFPENAENQAVIWTSSNTKVATVDELGLVKVKKKTGGKSVVITATAADGSGVKAVYSIQSMKGVVTSVKLSGKEGVKAGKQIKLKAKVKASKKANKKLQWSSSNEEYATVSASGKVQTTAAGKGKTVKITVKATDGSGKKAVWKLKIK